MLSKDQIDQIVADEESQSLGFCGSDSELQRNRATLLDYYNQKPFGDEIEGMSTIVTSDVHDVVEGALPNLVRMFSQNRNLARFVANREEYEEECKQKSEYCSYVLRSQHDFTKLLYDYLKDGLLQYTGVLETYWDDTKEVKPANYRGLSELELDKVKTDKSIEIKSIEVVEGDFTAEEIEGFKLLGQPLPKTYDIIADQTMKTGRVRVEAVPPNEFIISQRARDFENPPLIGKRTPKTRSDLVAMGLPRDIVDELKSDSKIDDEVDDSLSYKIDGVNDSNPTSDRSKDIIYLGSYYVQIDIDEDGISELWHVLFADGKVLEKNRVEDHPFGIFVPTPMPHTTIGSCPAEEAADIQKWKSTLVRQLNNNIYSTNYSRVLYNENVDPDDLFNPLPGGGIAVDGKGPAGEAVFPLQVQNQSVEILQAIEYVDSTREARTGVTRHSQGLDTESLNKTATGFQGLRDMSQMRIEVMARLAASGLKRVCEMIVRLAAENQDDAVQTRVHGQPLELNPSTWRDSSLCSIEIGTGSGDLQNQLAVMQRTLDLQMGLWQQGSLLVDQSKIYNTLEKLSSLSGMKEVSMFFNDPSSDAEVLQAENEQLKKALEQLQAQTQNPLAEAEQVRAQAKLQEKQMDMEHKSSIKIAELQQKLADKQAELEQKERHHDDKLATELSELELKYSTDVPGALI